MYRSGWPGHSQVAILGTLIALTWVAPVVSQETTERQMLSGRGFGDTVDWQFSVTEGRRAGEQTTIPVPSHWEQHGFGSYNYGHDDDKSREQGHYRHRFEVPEAWRGKTIDLVFEAVMTDAEVRVNGQSAGSRHHGAFYRFRYDVSQLLRFDEANELEVTVSKHSAEKSVNRAERDADYWVFGGIFRPVYLEARPPESIDHVAIDARHDGSLAARVRLRGLTGPVQLSARVETLDGQTVGVPFSAEAGPSGQETVLEARFDDVKPWSAERPDLYHLVLELERSGGALHQHIERFGFRTVEARVDGLYVNDVRVLLKGINRHSFWPASGRTLNPQLNRRDAELIQGMNFNAVRMSHYPPDKAFLEACDELGLYVINELAGWHDAYSTSVGQKLVRELVERDVNHPSIILWANGNEDGWNTALDDDFALYDPQERIVIHPRSIFAGFNTDHYPDWDMLESMLDPGSLQNRWRSLFGDLPLVLPTEWLHGLYDGGSGAALDDYWQRLRESPRAAGAFLWVFTDEAIERTDRDGELDTDGNHAPDGVLGPYREPSATADAVREIFSPVQIIEERFDGSVTVENRYHRTDLSEGRFDWRLLDLPVPGNSGIKTLAEGTLPGPAVVPGEQGTLRLPPAIDWRRADALSLTAKNAKERELWTWVLPIRDSRTALRPLVTAGSGSIEAIESDGRLTLRSTAAEVSFDLATGRLLSLAPVEQSSPLTFDGPHFVGTKGGGTAQVQHRPREGAYGVDGVQGSASIHWLFLPSGWLRLTYSFEAEGEKDFFGIRFDTVEEDVRAVRWLGDGPGRVWKNRLRGGTLGLWQKTASATTSVEAAHEPKLAGYYADVVWAELEAADRVLQIAFDSSSPELYLGLFSPSFPEDARDAVAAVPSGGISFLHDISAIGTKFEPAHALGPQSRRTDASGRYRGIVWFRIAPFRNEQR